MKAGQHAIFVSILICCVQIHLSSQPQFSSSEYRFQHFDMSDGLASESAMGITQDSLGFLWILHDNGLSRYDGYNFKIYQRDPKDSLGPGPPLDGFLELDHHGNLWVVSNQWILPNNPIILTRYDRRRDAFIKYFPDMKGVLVRSIAFDHNDNCEFTNNRKKRADLCERFGHWYSR